MKLILAALFLLANTALADAPVIWSGSTVKWLPSGLKAAGMCINDANGVMTMLPPGAAGNVPVSDGSQWTSASGNATFWKLTGNSGTTPGTHFLGTTDAQDLQLKTNNQTRMTLASDGKISSYSSTDIGLNTTNTQTLFQAGITPTASQAGSFTRAFEANAIYDQLNAGFNTAGVSTIFSRWEHDGSGTIDFGSAFDGSIYFGPNGGTTNLYKGLNLDVGLNAATVNSFYGVSSTANVSNGATIGNWTSGFFGGGFADTTVSQSIFGVQGSPGTSGATTIANDLVGVDGSPYAAGSTAITGSVFGLRGYPNLQGTASAQNIFGIASGISLQGNSTVVTARGADVNVNLSGSSSATNVEGMTITTSSSNPVSTSKGLTINIDNVSAPIDQRQALSASGGGTNLSYDVNLSSTNPGYWQTHYVGGSAHVTAGNPISTFGFGTNMAQLVDFQDDWTADFTGLHLGWVNTGFVGSITGATGKTMDAWTGVLAGAGNPSGAGTITSARMMRAAGMLPQGGSLSVTNMYGFSVMASLCAIAGNCWGIYDEGSGAENYLERLALNTASKKVVNSDTALEIGSSKAFVNGRGTTAQKNALAAVAGMQFFDTDLAELQWYDGTNWITASGSGAIPTLTAGSVVFSNGTTITEDASNFHYDSTGHKLSIGSNVVNGRLDVTNTDDAIRGNIVLFGQGRNPNSEWLLYDSPNGAMSWYQPNQANYGFTWDAQGHTGAGGSSLGSPDAVFIVKPNAGQTTWPNIVARAQVSQTADFLQAVASDGTTIKAKVDINGKGTFAGLQDTTLASTMVKADGSGNLTAATSGTDYAPATSGSAILKGNGSGGFSSAVAGTDYVAATTGSAIQKANGSGGLTAAVSGTDYAPATSGSSILKGNGSGGFSSAVSGTDYAPATSGTSILYGDGSGGFSNVTVGSGLTFSGGTLSASGTASPLTTKGDLYTYSTVGTRLPVGTDGYALVADSTQTTGLKYSNTINGVTLSGGGGTGSISIAPSKSVAFNNSLAFSGTDGSTLNIGSGGTLGTAAFIAAPSGTSSQLLANSGSGTFSNVTIGSGLSYSGGTLSYSGTTAALTKSVSQTGHGFSVGDLVYHTGSAYAKAKADAATTAEVVGVVAAVADANTFTLQFGGYVTGLGGLTAGTTYFLSAATAGGITATEPSTAGYVSKPVLVADSTSSGYILNTRGVVIASTVSPGNVSSSYSGSDRLERAMIANNGSTATITSQSGSWISSVSRSGAGNVVITIASGIFTAEPACVVSNRNGTTRVAAVDATGGSATQVTVRTFATNDVATDDPFAIHCMGPH